MPLPIWLAPQAKTQDGMHGRQQNAGTSAGGKADQRIAGDGG